MLKVFALLMALTGALAAQVTNLSITARTSSSISFSWTTSSNDKNDFVKYSTGSSCSLSMSAASSSNCQLTHTASVTGLAAGTAYCFRVGGTSCGNLTVEQGAQVIVYTLDYSPTVTPTPSNSPTMTRSPTPVATATPTPTNSPVVAASIVYTATPAPWASTPPADVKSALDRLAAAVQALRATTPIP